jgi:hypothetical protein
VLLLLAWSTTGRTQIPPTPEVAHPVTAAQPPGAMTDDEFSLELPTPANLFRVESEAQALEKIRQLAIKKQIKKIEFPEGAKPGMIVSPSLVHRPAQEALYPANVVCFRTLYFEDRRTEWYLQSCGVLEPFRSAFLFYGQALTLPVRAALVPPWRYECRNH